MWSDPGDIGARDYAFQRGSVYGGSPHGCGAGGSVTQSIQADGATIDPTQAATASSGFVITRTETIAFTDCTVTVTCTETFAPDGTVTTAYSGITSTQSLGIFYAGMNIGSGSYIETDSGAAGALLRTRSAADRGIYGATAVARTRNVDDGRFITFTSNAAAATGFVRREVDRYPGLARTKVYDRFTGTPNALGGISNTMVFGQATSGASSFAASLITNGDGSSLTGWTQPSGTTTATGGKFQQVLGGSQNKLMQAVTVEANTKYQLSVDGDSTLGNVAVGLNSNGSTSSPAPLLNYSVVVGTNAFVFDTGANTTVYIILYTNTGSGTVTFDNVSLVKLAGVS